jgi:hypothetical protein
LRCLGIARQELEYRKSLGYDKLNTGLDDEQPKVESFTTPDGIKVVTTLESTTVDTDTEKDSNAVRVTVEAGTRSMNVEIVALVVEGGF